jgi:hypothetical protein
MFNSRRQWGCAVKHRSVVDVRGFARDFPAFSGHVGDSAKTKPGLANLPRYRAELTKLRSGS